MVRYDQAEAWSGTGPRRGTWSGFWRGQALFWFFLTLFGLVARSLIYEDLRVALVLVLVLEPAAVLMTWMLRSIYLRCIDLHSVHLATFCVVGLLCALAALMEIALAGTVRAVFAWPIPDAKLMRWTVLPLGYYWIVFVGWSLLYLWMNTVIAASEERARAVTAEALAARGELDRLHLQLDPHLIFNALNGIAVEVPERPSVALHMLEDLSHYLRSSLQNVRQAVCTVAEEVTVVRSFLAIQQARFGDQLRLQVQVAEEALSRHLPSFVMQLLVENAIKHGLRGGSDILLVTVDVGLRGNALTLEVRNDGRLLSDWSGRAGLSLGIANLTRRLELHYPGRHRFTLKEEGEQVVATLEVEGRACFA